MCCDLSHPAVLIAREASDSALSRDSALYRHKTPPAYTVGLLGNAFKRGTRLSAFDPSRIPSIS